MHCVQSTNLTYYKDTMLLNIGVALNVKPAINGFSPTTFPQFLANSLTALKLPEISRFSSQVITLHSTPSSQASAMNHNCPNNALMNVAKKLI